MMQLHDECPNDLSKYELLAQLAATNVSLLYYVLIHNLELLAPIVYTPTVGEACQKYDRIFRWPSSGPIPAPWHAALCTSDKAIYHLGLALQ